MTALANKIIFEVYKNIWFVTVSCRKMSVLRLFFENAQNFLAKSKRRGKSWEKIVAQNELVARF
ncbi:hypothetical protein LPO01_03070 [Ligilactobacillus pobuzihii]|nr:hypothetical protein LPO01_03070 [Ligilactobacillus pobuzihii]